MKKMTFLFSWLFLMLLHPAQAENMEVSGRVLFGEEQTPVPGFPVELAFLEQNLFLPAITDEGGAFHFAFDFDFSPAVPALIGQLSVMDFCTGQIVEVEIALLQDLPVVAGIDLVVCSDLNPPPPPEHCEAFFFYEQVESAPYLVQFYDISSASADIESWLWDFGDGQTSTEQEPLHEFPGPGAFPVSLTISADTCSSTFLMHVEIFEQPACDCWNLPYEPVCIEVVPGQVELFENFCYAQCAGFSAADLADCGELGFDFCEAYFFYEQGSDSLSVQFWDASWSLADSITIYNWIMPTGEVLEGPSPTYAFPAEGEYVVILEITTAGGCSSIYETVVHVGGGFTGCACDDAFDPVCVANEAGQIIVLPNACIAVCLGYSPSDFLPDCTDPCDCDFTYDPVCIATPSGQTIEFPNACLAVCEGFSPEDIVECEAVGCDDCPAVFAPVCVVQEGDTLTFENSCFALCTGFTPDQFIQCDIAPPCDCDFTYDPVCVATPSGQILEFPNACFAACEGYDESVYYECGGTAGCECYQVYAPVCVTLPTGDVLTFQNDCYAECAGFGPDWYEPCDGGEPFCEALFESFPADAPGSVQFLDYSFSTSPIVSWEWDFAGQGSSVEQNPVFIFEGTGMAEVVLTITTEDGCTSSQAQTVFIGNGGAGNTPDCQAMFTFSQNADNPLSFVFEDLSMGDAQSWFWSFGDGNSSTLPSPVHTYSSPGLYLVTLTVNNGNCSSSLSMLILTDAGILYDTECQALFVPLQIDSLTYAFLNLSSDFAATFEWDFGDGQTSTEPLPLHTYAAPGNYEATLTLSTPDGCTSVFTMVLSTTGNGFTGQPSYRIATATTGPEPAGANARAYPNPTRSAIQVVWDRADAGPFSYQLTDMRGRILASGEALPGHVPFAIDMQPWPAGLYLLQLQNKNGAQALRIVKQ
ncbi:PKD domain-containing protein [Phaeodactylibacter luteus]|uniref:PKD domain-containing protein n=1 Tax=Phaeodactylibacter luteus TaxID=1564516 RepID=A0A5C6S633_9BACT|nr:PKD domain-containing protein [Phaeodactylibacter luteus]TXB69461.1 PKD domain-containing protein [Phaeodactylibacter luteus]